MSYLRMRPSRGLSARELLAPSTRSAASRNRGNRPTPTSRHAERRRLAWLPLPCVALEICRGKGFERLHEARQGRLHHAGPDLPDPCLAMGYAGVDPGYDGRFDDLPDVNPTGHSQTVERRQQQMRVTPGGNLQHLLGI